MTEKKWVPLESNPDVLNDYAASLGLQLDAHEFTDVLGLDDVRLRAVRYLASLSRPEDACRAAASHSCMHVYAPGGSRDSWSALQVRFSAWDGACDSVLAAGSACTIAHGQCTWSFNMGMRRRLNDQAT